MNLKNIIRGLKYISDNQAECEEINFIQLIYKNQPFFQSGPQNSKELLEDFLMSINIKSTDNNQNNIKQNSLYKIVGAGTIKDNKTKYILEGYCELLNLYPNMDHIKTLEPYFQLPVEFGGEQFETEEERDFLGNYDDLDEKYIAEEFDKPTGEEGPDDLPF